MNTQQLEQLKHQRSILGSFLQQQRSILAGETHASLRIVMEISLLILEDAIGILNSIVEYVSIHQQADIDEGSSSSLTSREMDVLKCMARGLSNSDIAQTLEISHQTAKNHVTSVLHKLGVNGRTQAVMYALQSSWALFQDADEEEG